jgi:hypothetical protein
VREPGREVVSGGQVKQGAQLRLGVRGAHLGDAGVEAVGKDRSMFSSRSRSSGFWMIR